MIKSNYIYDDVTVLRVVDGDTIAVLMVIEVDVGFGFVMKTSFTQMLRMAGINAPETSGASKVAGLASKVWLEHRLPPGTKIITRTIKPREKYGRYLAEVFLPGITPAINQEMIELNLAVPYKD